MPEGSAAAAGEGLLPTKGPVPPWAARAGFVLLAALCFLGVVNTGMDAVMAPVHGSNAEYLEKSLVYSGGVIAGLTAVRAGVSVMESGSVKFLGTGIEPGRAVGPVNDLLADITDYMLVYAVLIAAQMAITEVIAAVSLKYVLGAGALLCALGFGGMAGRRLWRTGMLLISIGLVLYVVYPLVLMGSARVFEAHQARASLELSDNVRALTGQAEQMARELKGSLSSFKDAASGASAVFSRLIRFARRGIATLYSAVMGLMVSMVIMFIITPVAALGISWFCIRQAVQSIEGAATADAMDERIVRALERMGRRGRAARNDTQQDARPMDRDV